MKRRVWWNVWNETRSRVVFHVIGKDLAEARQAASMAGFNKACDVRKTTVPASRNLTRIGATKAFLAGFIFDDPASEFHI